MSAPVLDPIEIRVLGSLVEKQITTPDYYPLSLNALTNACNQINNRDPVVSCSETEVTRALDRLRDKRLAYVVSGAESRVVKFGHKLGETLELPRPEIAVLCELMLRGPQTAGELRGRCARMHPFADPADVLATLGKLASRAEPLVAVLPRQPGTKESRHAHLLSGEPVSPPSTAAEPARAAASPEAADRVAQLEAEVASLKQQLDFLQRQFAEFKKQFE